VLVASLPGEENRTGTKHQQQPGADQQGVAFGTGVGQLTGRGDSR
jgi:hypothetical protein